ncbi:MAG: tRNA lysidine(34) synthetase TilS [Boseongicola sp.]|nr:tRNA lysidine(34) synthetase TilS [Boseongicola sp.]MDD9977524.1 tRNA lysidine(34) synthetase TilS [Boseongicola sp.]
MTSPAWLVDRIDGAFGGHEKPEKIGVAVSGGSDSLALLHLLHTWGQVPIVAATVDHGLRPEAPEEAAQVAEICSKLGIPHTTLQWQGWTGKGNLQDQARQNRYSLLAKWAKTEGCDTVCLGHTMDDQAETFLMRLSRASGVDALAGMESRIWRHDQRFDRPLLRVRREHLQDYLGSLGVQWIDDPSNDDDRFDRIKARKAVAQLEDLGITPENITHSMIHLSLAGIELRERAHEIAQKICKEPSGDVVFGLTAFRLLNPEMQHRLLSQVLMFVSGEPYPPRREAMNIAEAALTTEKNHTLHGCCILVSKMTVRITREYKAVERVHSTSDQLWDGRWKLDGPHNDQLQVRALGDALKDVPNWRDTGMPRTSLLATPSIWSGNDLISAPIAGYSNGWTASATGRGTFAQFLLSR